MNTWLFFGGVTSTKGKIIVHTQIALLWYFTYRCVGCIATYRQGMPVVACIYLDILYMIDYMDRIFLF